MLTGVSKDFGLELFRSVEEDGRPATFSWSHERGDERTFNSDLALRFTRKNIVAGSFSQRLFADAPARVLLGG